MYTSSKMPGHLIRRLHQLSTQLFLQRVTKAGFDLTSVQFAALDALRHRPGTDQAGLAEAISKDRATVGAVADRLEQKGLVRRDVNAQDKRAWKLSLTAKGEEVLSAASPIVESIQKEILPGLNEAEYQQFIALATKAAQAAAMPSQSRGRRTATASHHTQAQLDGGRRRNPAGLQADAGLVAGRK